MASSNPTTIVTTHHVIEVSEGCLSIGETRFPDSCVSLSPEETEAALNLLLAQKYGAQGTEILKWLGRE